MTITLPDEPPVGLLVSIALRLDHALLAPMPRSHTADGFTMETKEQHLRRIEVGLADARRAYEEITGKGFWKPENNDAYEEQLAALKGEIAT